MSCDAVVSSGDSMPEGDKVAELHAVLQHISPMPKCRTVLLEKESLKVSCKRPAGKKAAGRTAAKCSKGKLKCSLDKGRKPSSFPPAVPTKKNAVLC